MTDPASLPYRRNVGAVILNSVGAVFVARRTDMPGAGGGPDEGVWQCPQGGIDAHEAPETAVFREVEEETGMTSLTLLEERPDWLSYDLPADLIGKALKGRYRGQTQKWFALRFTGAETEIRLDLQKHQEFDAWKWVPLAQLPLLNVGFKKPVYEQIVRDFAHLV
ncbi:dinucleoside polyphosphate hydrolase [Acetobacter estunensis NRIC 0472]|uniref:RNA pyrophosphohydrolase n=1 Tax=Acetobacter estunensis TaxID=104097 RepID=A0A967ED60_9PROT|nr:RNA pyrophosphohydrolase [Acetobacter estunensis]NHO53976.1 RNA pyrophosphohydrolase [Acetobacter estunensis]GBQ20692.1 dinucleoside polyphosphate hydrolase [Acetobacter estunensis NRIC 0472]